jgi:hypothetical protein
MVTITLHIHLMVLQCYRGVHVAHSSLSSASQRRSPDRRCPRHHAPGQPFVQAAVCSPYALVDEQLGLGAGQAAAHELHDVGVPDVCARMLVELRVCGPDSHAQRKVYTEYAAHAEV